MDDRALTQARFHGTVLWFDMAKGFGFIVPDDQPEQRVFVEHSCIDLPGYRVLTERQRVVFTFEPEVSSARATWVRPL
ncbi:cold shock domain-containing protein [Nocardia sp. NPDC005978]|uniref:cold shock domain-containing protein n=1 Tax=Nocardia sp. NPDC005978 TaxID=3156725 RepID=UPI0033BE30DC